MGQTYYSTRVAIEQLSVGETFSGPTIIVKIGQEEKPYYISKALAMHRSGYVRGAFNSDNFAESATGEISLREVEPCVFELFLEWLYTMRLPNTRVWHKKYKIAKERSIGRQLANLYVFADRFLVPDLKKLVIKITVYVTNGVTKTAPPEYDTLSFVFDSLPEDDIYIQLLVDIHCRRWTAKMHNDELSLDQDIEQLPTSFFLKAMDTYAKMQAAEDKKKPFKTQDYLDCKCSCSKA